MTAHIHDRTTEPPASDAAPLDDRALQHRQEAARGDVFACIDEALATPFASRSDVCWAFAMALENEAELAEDADVLTAWATEAREFGRRIACTEVLSAWMPLGVASDVIRNLEAGFCADAFSDIPQSDVAGEVARLVRNRAHASLTAEEQEACAVAVAQEWGKW